MPAVEGARFSCEGFFGVKWRVRSCWLVPSLLALVVAAAMASPGQANNSSQAARLKTLLKNALLSRGNTSSASGNPVFTALSQDFNAFGAALNSRGIKIAVVTFGDPKAIGGRPGRIGGEPLVRRVLKESNASFEVEEVFAFYPPLYSSPADYRPLGLSARMPHNKSYHLRRLREHFGVSNEEVLLIDDDANNCGAFVAEGGVALLVTGEEGFNFSQLEVL
ncbi:hypothetical protein Emag_006629 [Eimeria magna]